MAASTEGGLRAGQARPAAGRRKAPGGGVGRGGEGGGGGVAAEPPLPERSLRPAADAGSRVRRAPAGLRASVRGHRCTVPRGLRLGAGRRCRRRRPLPPPPPTPRTKPPHPDSRGAAAAAKSSAAYWLPRRLPGNAVPGSGRWGAGGGRGWCGAGRRGQSEKQNWKQPEGV